MSRRREPGRGSAAIGGRFTVGFDDETIEEVRALALVDRVAFAEKIRQLVDWGLEAVKKERQPGATARPQNR